MEPCILLQSDISRWESEASIDNFAEKKSRYSPFANELDYIIKFIKSGEPRAKRDHKKSGKLKKEKLHKSCPICEVNFRVGNNVALSLWDAPSLEHVISLDWGGKTTAENTIVICSSCNQTFSEMEKGMLPIRKTIHGDGRVGGKKKKGDSKRKRIRTPEMIANLPNGWEIEIIEQYIFQRLMVHSKQCARRDFPDRWSRFWKNKFIVINVNNNVLRKKKPSDIPTEHDFSSIIGESTDYE